MTGTPARRPELDIPELLVAPPESGVQVGIPALRYKGELLTFPTMGPFRIEMADDDITTVTVTIPVRIVTGEPETDS